MSYITCEAKICSTPTLLAHYSYQNINVYSGGGTEKSEASTKFENKRSTTHGERRGGGKERVMDNLSGRSVLILG